MSIQHRNRSAVTSAAHVDWQHAAPAILLPAMAVQPLGLFFLVSPPLVVPSLSAAALASAAVIALLAWWMSADRNDAGISLWDVSGAYAFIGFAAGMLSEPQQVLEFLSGPAEISGRLGIGYSY
ncbi:MAG: hypothetical protein J0H62_05990 [Rhizobiales bacterium]|nr:hypothetical protein [Hyphomicrobiales bacterium]